MREEIIGDCRLILGDCRDVLPTLGKFDAVITDPPYFGVKADDWDNQWKDERAFLEWVGSIVEGFNSALNEWGSLYFFASPQMARKVEGVIDERMEVLNSIRWVKPQGWHKKQPIEAMRKFQQNWEACIFAQKVDDHYSEKCDRLHRRVFSQIGQYFKSEREKAGKSYREVASYISRDSALYLRWEEGSSLPNPVDYAKCQELFNGEQLRKDYEQLRKDYEQLRKDYEQLRRPFLPFDKRLVGDIWEFDVVGGYASKHPCEKPLPLMGHIVGTSTRADHAVLDPFMGSGTTGVACANMGRKFTGIEREPKYFDIACKRIDDAYRQTRMFA